MKVFYLNYPLFAVLLPHDAIVRQRGGSVGNRAAAWGCLIATRCNRAAAWGIGLSKEDDLEEWVQQHVVKAVM